SRIAKEPVIVPQGVEVSIDGQKLTIKSKKGQMTLNVHPSVKVNFADNALTVEQVGETKESNMQAGTTRALMHNMVVGLDKGFEKKLQLVGVGFRAQAKGNVLSLALGFSHP
ncbi:50S ribosomal protein L6, partial [Enterobacter cloacae]